MALCYGDPGRVTPEGFRHAVEEMERRMLLPYTWDAMTRSARGLVNAYTLGGQHALWRQAERVLAPTLLVYGGRDQLVGFRMAQKAARAFRDSRLLTLPEAGHVAMMEYPETVATAVRHLLAETGQKGSARPSGQSGEWHVVSRAAAVSEGEAASAGADDGASASGGACAPGGAAPGESSATGAGG